MKPIPCKWLSGAMTPLQRILDAASGRSDVMLAHTVFPNNMLRPAIGMGLTRIEDSGELQSIGYTFVGSMQRA